LRDLRQPAGPSPGPPPRGGGPLWPGSAVAPEVEQECQQE
jgi:hypothetical protein